MKRLLTIAIPTITFIMGILAQMLLEQWLKIRDLNSISLLTIIICFLLSITILELLDKRISILDKKIDDFSNKTGLTIKYVEDDDAYNSYKECIKVISNAQKSIISVSPWVSFKDNKRLLANNQLTDDRKEYYRQLKLQIGKHHNENDIFHMRIIQVENNFTNKSLDFHVDPVYLDYLKYASDTQKDHPRICRLKKANTIIDIHFTIVDDRYIIMPMLSQSETGLRQNRKGAFFFEDAQGNLVKALKSIYELIDARAEPLSIDN